MECFWSCKGLLDQEIERTMKCASFMIYPVRPFPLSGSVELRQKLIYNGHTLVSFQLD